ncbi:hypothetical protein [Streptomyces lavendulocolor]|uniref:glycan biosynthesis hexose transferase WsfD n=1 Tax=Streptomyces lavendulocolor TaxID=67316 RepID=UPI0033D11C0C
MLGIRHAARTAIQYIAPRKAAFTPSWWITLLVGTVATCLMALRVFVPTVTGLADDGSSHRLTCVIGLVPHHAADAAHMSPYFDYLNLRWDRGEPTVGCPNFPSSERWLLSVAQTITSWLDLPGALDLRVLAAWWCLITGVAVAATFALVRAALSRRLLASSVLLVVLADSAFVNYAASMNVHLAALSGLVAASVGVVMMFGRFRRRAAGCGIFTVGGILVVGAEPANAAMALPFLVVLALTRVPWRTMSGPWSCRLLPGMCALLLAGVSLNMHAGEEARIGDVRAYNQAFVSLLGNSSEPAQDSVDLGLPASFATYAGQSWWATPSARQDPAWPKHARSITPTNIQSFLLRHPGAALDLASRSAQQLLTFRPAQIGTYPRGNDAPPRSIDCRWCVVSAVGQIFAPRALSTLLLYLMVCTLIASALVRSARRFSRCWAFSAAACFMSGFTVVGFIIGALGDPLESPKAMVAPALSACFVGVMLVCAWCSTGKEPLDSADPATALRPLRSALQQPQSTSTAAATHPQ